MLWLLASVTSLGKEIEQRRGNAASESPCIVQRLKLVCHRG
jgi:hypothetical protein